MPVDRRGFLKIAGLAGAAGLGGAKALSALAEDGKGNWEPFQSARETVTDGRWAMVVLVNKCMEADEHCNACSVACHKSHNVPHIEDSDDEVKWIWRQDFHGAFPEQEPEIVPTDLHHFEFPVLCNHCDHPPCVRVCPTQTTWKREDGVVMMDMHRCIGCRYCIAACPYGSRSFNWSDPRKHLEETHSSFPTRSRGVVEKCNFCAEKLARGESPVCVEACPNTALLFGDLRDPKSEVYDVLHTSYAVRRKPSLGTQPQVYYVI
jgi:Fe-S-cluster-containing dehydrogenase component